MMRTRSAAEPEFESKAEPANDVATPRRQTDNHRGDRHSGDSASHPQLLYSQGRLDEDLQQLQSKWQAVGQELQNRDEAIAVLELEATKHQESTAALKEQLSRLHDEVDQHKNDAKEADARADRIESENVALRLTLQESRDYIDGRKDDWEKLNEQLAEYQDTIEGMSESLESHDAIVSQQEDEKAALALKVMELERDLSELQGRHAEKDASRAELQQTIENQSRELGRLNLEIKQLQEDAKKSRKKLERGGGKVSKMQDLRIADLESSLQDMQASNEELSNELASRIRQLEEANSRSAEQEIRVAEQEASLLEAESVRSELQKELDAQCELVKALEHELNNKQHGFEALDRSIDELLAGGEAREHDRRFDADRRLGEEPKHVFVVRDPLTGAKTRYPIYSKETTIGRSSRNDIFLDSKYVSRVHAKVRIAGSKVIIEDAGSKNGFRVNSVRARRHTLKNGDRLSIGSEELSYLNLASEGTRG